MFFADTRNYRIWRLAKQRLCFEPIFKIGGYDRVGLHPGFPCLQLLQQYKSQNL